MKLWKKAAGLIKDRNSIWVASISRRSSYRNPDLESIVIKATSHDESYVDYKNFHRVYEWVRTSPVYVKPLLWSVSSRMEKTRSWVVALKGLMLMHGVFCCKIPAVQRIGRLPFDLSNFTDGHSSPNKTWPYDSFVRAYFTFLDQRSMFLHETASNAVLVKKQQQLGKFQRQGSGLDFQDEPNLMDELGRLQKWQSLLDMLLEIRPNPSTAKVYLVFEAMICVLTEIFDVYSNICKGIARALMKIYAAPGKGAEAQMALGVVQKASMQGEDLGLYLDFCRDLGVLGSNECPKVEQIPEEDIRDLERIIKQASSNNNAEVKEMDENDETNNSKALVVNEEQTRVISSTTSKKGLKTIITDKWEVFPDSDLISWVSADAGYSDQTSGAAGATDYKNPFASSSNLMPYAAPAPAQNLQLALPDLISL